MNLNRTTTEVPIGGPGFERLSRCWLIGGLVITCVLLAKAGASWSVGRSVAQRASDATRVPGLATKSIEAVRSGERVMAFDFASQTWQPCDVIQRIEREYSGEIVAITIAKETIRATGNHPFWVCAGVELDYRPSPEHVSPHQSASGLSGRWVDAGDLRVGDELLLASGESTTVRAIDRTLEKRKVFNLDVANLHTYSVGHSGILVHNREPNGGSAKPHGGPKHDGAIDNRVGALREDSSVTNIRKNQQQVDVDGNNVGKNRPDVQYDKDGVHNNEEFDYSKSRSDEHKATIEANDPKASNKFDILDDD